MQSENQEGDRLDVLWGAKEIATFLRTTERKVFYYADRGYLPIKRQGRLLIASKAALRRHFSADVVAAAPAPQARRSGRKPAAASSRTPSEATT